jgi:hypothetical protein
MRIHWNEVTWYTRLMAAIVIAGGFIVAYWLGMQVQKTTDDAQYAQVLAANLQPIPSYAIRVSHARAVAKNSICNLRGTLGNGVFYNPISQTWWLDLVPRVSNPSCNPACVVSEESGQAQINWRCTSLFTPQ